MDLEGRIKRLEELAEKEKIKFFEIIFTSELAKLSNEESVILLAKHFNMTPCNSLWNTQRVTLWCQELTREAQKKTPKEIYYWVMDMFRKSNF